MQRVVVPKESGNPPSNSPFRADIFTYARGEENVFTASSMFQSSSSVLARSHRPGFLPERAQLLVLRRRFPLSDEPRQAHAIG